MRIVYIFLLATLYPFLALGQPADAVNQTLQAFEKYSELPREVAYVHLNKSIYLKGEDIGFKAYVYDKDNKRPSQETRNLYCVIADSNLRIVKSQLVQISNGVGQGLFELDSLFQTGTYTFRAYTNWMRNFSETNYFEQRLNIVDPETDSALPVQEITPGLDAQFLPEGGHAVTGVETVYGVIIKDTRSFGAAGLEGRIEDNRGQEITRFKLNRFGIGRFALTPSAGDSYWAFFEYQGKTYRLPLPQAESQGIGMKLTEMNTRIGLEFKAKGKRATRNQNYLLTLHNGDSIKALPIQLDEKDSQIQILRKSDLYKGVNVLTLFDADMTPLLERLYFNAQGLVFHRSDGPYTRQVADSLEVTFHLPELDPNYFSSLSISVLPECTKSYGSHHNLPSYTLLQPYVKGPIQQASYYFQDWDAKKQYELDNLLLTQGWSSYDWHTLAQKPPPQPIFDFEKGISLTVRLNAAREGKYLILPTANNISQIVETLPGQESFGLDGYFPREGEKISLAAVKENGMSRPIGAYIQFKPSGIPEFKTGGAVVLPNPVGARLAEVDIPPISFENLERLQMLEEVVITENLQRTRMEMLRDRSIGKLDYFETNDPRRNQFLSNYLSGRGYIVDEGLGTVQIRARNPNSPNNSRPIVYLDGVLLTDFDILWRFRLDIVDYIEVNPAGIGSGIMGGGGVIRIVTDPNLRIGSDPSRNAFNSYDVPLAFGIPKRYYTPVYASHSGPFFEHYGTLDWIPDLRPGPDGQFSLRLKDYGLESFTLYVEGIVNGDDYISRVIRASKADP
ncbi:hypothetical protein OZ410_02760 [Robiginitalea sp. M366]|uniref:hypothetical protein n=1 Tax=Robiginitalea aestuariiviva TaxID=3036903 RepID=UPI00240E5B60|nr:hypothetical protein [Robiginitalea aestuariiviva]MDG1571220.1 hypothetical protein [Robiginitalea aestuariiviva]